MEQGGFPLAWVGLVQDGSVMPAASFGPAAGYLQAITPVLKRGPLPDGAVSVSVKVSC